MAIDSNMKNDKMTVKVMDTDLLEGRISHDKLFVGKPRESEVDSKKRVIIPSKFRRYFPNIAGRIIAYFVPSPSKFTIGRIYHPNVYEKIASSHLLDEDKKFFTNSTRLELDNQGRTNSGLAEYLDGVNVLCFIPEGDCMVLKKRK